MLVLDGQSTEDTQCIYLSLQGQELPTTAPHSLEKYYLMGGRVHVHGNKVKHGE